MASLYNDPPYKPTPQDYAEMEADFEEQEFARISNELQRLHPSEQQRLKEMLDRVLVANEEYAESESPW